FLPNNSSSHAIKTLPLHDALPDLYGVRWELNPPPHEAKGNDPFTVQGLDQPATAALAPRGTPLWQTTYGNFAPRIGTAYSLSARDRKSTRLNSSHQIISYAVFCLK